ncbi:putative sulfate exporter family transporter [Parasphingorhabdus sp.]
MAADLYGELQLSEPDPKRGLFSIVPGLALVGVIALAALWLSEHYGPPVILMGLLIGLALNFVNANEKLLPGLDFASQTLLRCGIVLIGLRITFSQIAGLGITPFISLIVIMAAVILVGVVSAKLFRQDVMFGLLAGGATAICGASAALALWSIIGTRRLDQSQFTIVLLGITLASAFAMSFYPTIAAFLGFTDVQAGFLIGASIHDVAQAIGGGFSYSNDAGEVATIVKLSRVAMLAPILIIVSIVLSRSNVRDAGSQGSGITFRQAIPWFIVGFLILVGVNTFVQIPEPVTSIGSTAAQACLLFAVVAAAVKSNMSGLLAHGWRCFGPIVATTLTAFMLAMLFAVI